MAYIALKWKMYFGHWCELTHTLRKGQYLFKSTLKRCILVPFEKVWQLLYLFCFLRVHWTESEEWKYPWFDQTLTLVEEKRAMKWSDLFFLHTDSRRTLRILPAVSDSVWLQARAQLWPLHPKGLHMSDLQHRQHHLPFPVRQHHQVLTHVRHHCCAGSVSSITTVMCDCFLSLRCDVCKAVFHSSCKATCPVCPRCVRIQKYIERDLEDWSSC